MYVGLLPYHCVADVGFIIVDVGDAIVESIPRKLTYS